MNTKDFNSGAVHTETATEVRLDVRPFGNAQGEAIDSYLHDRVGALNMGVDTGGQRVVVLLHDSTAAIPASAHRWLAMLNASGAPTEIRQS